MDVSEEIRQIEFALNAKREMAGKSAEYREGFIAGCHFLLEFESHHYQKAAKNLSVSPER